MPLTPTNEALIQLQNWQFKKSNKLNKISELPDALKYPKKRCKRETT